MNTRRKFLFNGSMATAALFTLRPFTSVANSISPLTGFSINNNSLVLAHTGNALGVITSQTVQHIKQLKNNNANLLMLHAGESSFATQAPYDASMHSVPENDYKIVYKGDIKTGVITANDNTASAESINALAVYLKKEKDCHLVVCLSQLGYKSTKGLNDIALAEASTHLDIIIGGHADNFSKRPLTARNKNKEEVIINHAADNELAFRKIEMGFDKKGVKHQVSISKTC